MVEWMEPMAKAEVVDTTFYAVREKVGEELFSRLIMETLRPLIAAWLVEKGRRALVGADQFFYYEQFNPKKSVAPDVYVVDDVDPETPVTAWKTWETAAVPSFALEIVSGDRLKDYEEAPKRHAELGTRELVVFDPHHDEGSGARVRWQVFRRESGELVCVARSGGDRIESATLGCFLRAVGEGMGARVRLGVGVDGDELVPTDAERARAESKRAHAESNRARAESERAARAEAEVERLRARLAERHDTNEDD
jgi:hypothetical protein